MDAGHNSIAHWREPLPSTESSLSTSIRSLIEAGERSRAAGEAVVLASIIDTEGSTYRKAGARMLITRDREFHGLLGGGCFEGDLLEHASAVFDDGAPRTLLYDMGAWTGLQRCGDRAAAAARLGS